MQPIQKFIDYIKSGKDSSVIIDDRGIIHYNNSKYRIVAKKNDRIRIIYRCPWWFWLVNIVLLYPIVYGNDMIFVYIIMIDGIFGVYEARKKYKFRNYIYELYEKWHNDIV
jgi:hypothetical protein